MKKNFCLIFMCVLSVSVMAQEKGVSSMLKPIQVFPDKMVWTESKLPLPPGAQVSILEGDPKKEGMFTMRIKFPPKYLIPVHVHPKDERVTVLSGSIYLGIGDEMDEKSAVHFTTGSFYVNPTGIHHYVFTGNEAAEVQITGMGPWSLEYIDVKK